MNAIGDILRTERENQGRTIAGIADELCIMQAYVDALENGDVKSLPGLFFYKSFIRQYAAILRMDEKLVLSHLSALTAAEEAAAAVPSVRVPDPVVEDTNRRQVPDVPLGWSVTGLAAVLALCSVFYTWWNQPLSAPKASVTVQQQVQSAKVQPVADQSITVEPAAVQDVALKSAEGEAANEAGNTVVLKLSATEKTWLSISSNGHEIFSGVLQPSESKTLTGLDFATMKVGNAGGIDVRWNGKPIGPLGTSGQVLTIRFTPQNFEIVPPKQEL